jgi:hypothetical protein
MLSKAKEYISNLNQTLFDIVEEVNVEEETITNDRHQDFHFVRKLSQK